MIDYMADIQTLTKQFLTELQGEFVDYLANNNRNATGRSSRSIQVANVTPDGGKLVAGSWIEWVFTGRGPGAMPPISQIIDWLNAKGLPRGMAWAVAKNIAKRGTDLFRKGGKSNNAFTEILTEERISEFSKNIADLIAVEISSDIKTIFT